MYQILRKNGLGLKWFRKSSEYWTLSTVLCLTGCMGVYEGGFDCPPGAGVGCKSISEVNQMVNQESESRIPEIRNRESGIRTEGRCEENSPDACSLNSDSCFLTPDSCLWYSPFFNVQREKSKVRVPHASDSI